MYIEERGWVNAQTLFIIVINKNSVSKNNLQVYKIRFLICLFKFLSIILSCVITATMFFLQCETPGVKLLVTTGVVFAETHPYIT